MTIDTSHLLKVTAVWITILYVVCFGGVALFPDVRALFMRYALHTEIGIGNVVTFTTFVSGLIIWNLVAALGVGLFAVIHNRIPR